ncbi:MAG: hypothetical protein IT292_03845 [Deltaproteobacteria bacterium]|nr:hypothetical protein [Deltaproteobacteria bacterium]
MAINLLNLGTTMFISLVGMSGSGKSWWGRKLRDELGFKLICCDDLIAETLVQELPTGYSKQTEALAHWLGTPFDQRYAQRRAIYLHHEREALLHALSEVDKSMAVEDLARRPNIVIDTTGSVIYLDNEVLQKMQQLSLVVYLSLAEQEAGTLFRRYMKRPKPIIWQENFRLDPNLPRHDILFHNFAALNRDRQERYRWLAKVNVGLEECNADYMKASEFIEKINDHLYEK